MRREQKESLLRMVVEKVRKMGFDVKEVNVHRLTLRAEKNGKAWRVIVVPFKGGGWDWAWLPA